MWIEQIEDGLALHGDLDAATGPELDLAMLETRGPVVLDLSDITFMDSGGINALLRARALLGREDRTLALVRLSAPVRRTLETAGIVDLFEAAHR
jgi:anti-anti-sigma factor